MLLVFTILRELEITIVSLHNLGTSFTSQANLVSLNRLVEFFFYLISFFIDLVSLKISIELEENKEIYFMRHFYLKVLVIYLVRCILSYLHIFS